jgi:hypothetical protein
MMNALAVACTTRIAMASITNKLPAGKSSKNPDSRQHTPLAATPDTNANLMPILFNCSNKQMNELLYNKAYGDYRPNSIEKSIFLFHQFFSSMFSPRIFNVFL